MSDVPRQTLRDLVARHGPGLCSDARRCEGLLRDLCGAHRREINILISALKQHVPLDLLAAQGSMPRGLLLARLARRLEEQLALTAEAARWAVDSWALALGVVTDAELQDRQRQTVKAAAPPPPPTFGEDDAEKTAGEPARATPPVATQSRQPHVARPTPQTSQTSQTAPPPPATRQAGRRTSPLPPLPAPPPPQRQRAGRGPFSNWVVRSGPRSNAPSQTGMAQQQQQQAPPRGASPDPHARRRRGRSLRGCTIGCLLLVLLSVALFLGVPFVVSVLREEQQRRVNETPPAMSP
ncbi:MAG TPA: hypothetical protein VF240_01915 [Pyrinomonadaceae bacterium]